MTAPEGSMLSDDNLTEVMGLLAEADSVELKFTVPAAERFRTLTALGIDPLDAQIREVFFFDTPDLTLDKAGVVARARRIQGKGDDSVIKLRPVVPDTLPQDLRTSSEFVVEVDAMPGGYVCSGSLKAKLEPNRVMSTLTGDRSLRKLFSKAQRSFFTEHAPAGVSLDDLATLGPITVLKVKFDPPDFGRRLAVEMWLYPDGSRILELSTRCGPKEPFQVAAEAKAFLADKGVSIGGAQTTKTRAALGYFSQELAAG
jgi:hypothetical protein